MADQTRLHVAEPPAKPLMLWDGNCHFCKRWIERWRTLTRGAVVYERAQDAAGRYPEIPPAMFNQAVVYVDTDGYVYTAAEAVYRSLGTQRSGRSLCWAYDRIPGFAAISELFYNSIARHRTFASLATRLLWGDDVRPPTYYRARRWFLRSLGGVYLIAFVSLWIQIDGLVGNNGILPVGEFISAAGEQLGSHAWFSLPTLCWLNTSNAFLHVLCGTGVVASLALITGLAPAVCLVLLFVCYLSLTVAGQTFLSFQWDILLLETGFLAIFFAPWQLRFIRTREPPVSAVALFLLKLLLFKLMFMSGVVKLSSADDCWWNLTALDYHYWSQPLPTVFAWWADQHPEWLKKASVGFCLFVEIVVPFFLWAPRRLRLAAAALLVLLQLGIAVTGNYCFFNLLTIALCLLLLDDVIFQRRRSPSQQRSCNEAGLDIEPRTATSEAIARIQGFGAIALLVLTLPLNAWHMFSAVAPRAEPPHWVRAFESRLEPFYVANGYGLFRVMTKDRGEIIIEGSADGVDWLPYEFRWKPGNVTRPPGWCAPHQPRLDWQMWFAALSTARQNPWFLRTVGCLLENKPDVTSLLKTNPFPNQPPRYIRSTFYRYRFTSPAERSRTGAWWKREELGEYLQTVSLR